MDIERVDPVDTATVAQIVELGEAIVKVDSPWAHPFTVRSLSTMLTHGWDGEAPEQYVARIGGQVIASGRVWTSEWDNLDLAWLDVGVHPDHRRVGHGTALLQHLTDRSTGLGRTSLGISGWESAAARGYAEGAGFRFGQLEVNRRLDVEDVPDGFAASVEAARQEHAGDYEFLVLEGPLPEELRESASVMWSAINDAPWDDIEMDPEVFPIERILGYERAQLAGGKRLHRVIARHRRSGALAGHTVVAVEEERPHLADQHDTSVLVAHRGHRLGLVLKGLLLEHLRQAEPQVRAYDTWNAESNDHMIGVNEAMGFRIVGRAMAFQKKDRAAPTG